MFGINAFNANDTSVDSEYWVLPKFWIEKQNQTWQIHIVADCRNQAPNDCWNKLDQCLSALQSKQLIHVDQSYHQVSHHPEKEAWIEQVNQIKSIIQTQSVEKVVLSRQTTFTFSHKVHPFLLLKDVQQKDNGVYNFCIKQNDTTAFIGGTPERLFELTNNRIESDALAGTAFKPDGIDVEKIKQALKNQQKKHWRASIRGGFYSRSIQSTMQRLAGE